jgi:ubiquinone biosynthesis protein Coq4
MSEQTSTADFVMPKLARPMGDAEAAYFVGDKRPPHPSPLISSSKYLNDPLFRDAWCQVALRRYGDDVSHTYDLPKMFRAIWEVTDIREYVALVSDEKEKNAEFRDWVDNRRLLTFTASDFEGCHSDTLGGKLLDLMSQPGVSLEFNRPQEPVETDLDYVLKRRGLTHDIEHFVTGFGPNVLGEQALTMCNNASISNYFSGSLAHYLTLPMVFVTTAGIMRNLLHYPDTMPANYEAMRRATETGLALKKPLFMVDWENYLDWTIEDICTDLGICNYDDTAWRDLEAKMVG